MVNGGVILSSENQMMAKIISSPEHATRENILSGNHALISNDPKKQPSNKINIEAYQAYYNTNDSCQGSAQAAPLAQSHAAGPKVTAGASSGNGGAVEGGKGE